MYLNDLKIKYLKWKFETIDEIYKNGLSIKDAYIKAGYDVEDAIEWELQLKNFIHRIDKTPKFKALYEEYLVVMENKPQGFAVIPDRAKEIESINELVAKAYVYLTKEEVRSLRYNVTDIKNLIHQKLPKTREAMKSLVKNDFFEGQVYLDSQIKETLQYYHDKLLIKGKAKATDLKEFGDLKRAKISINGSRKDGYRISKLYAIFMSRMRSFQQ